ncbi:CHP02436-containing protein [Gemmatirosa kalamazoonensis]|uniref:CHP02436-containing protein n=1 Tax=Gemmatirosa kalamazoonensis TaxID=861299 RepID=W0RFD8_9BACT|nr:four helix bundle protein [Gemmatirosa kalamazoonensis]AHG89152.1 CHP02436-containing protein [Gemmatirosa kalamazoonensis]
MAEGDSFRDLRVWQEAQMLARDVNRVVRAFPPTHADLADQMRRAARSVHANIAEGNGKSSRRDYVRLLYDSRASLQEVESDVEALRDTDLATAADVAQMHTRARHVGVLLNALIRSLKPPPNS